MTGSSVLVRARDSEGRFIGDNPETPENEAWVSVTVPSDGAIT